MAYTTINKPNQYFNTVLYSGNGSTQSITGVGFQPDCTWIKVRNDTNVTLVHDVIRGATKEIYTPSTNTEATDTNGLTAFNSDGFSVGSAFGVNRSGYNFVNWSWKANGAGVSNNSGTITSTVSANTTSGFSIVKWTGTSATGTIGHGLGVAPKAVIVKSLANAEGWYSYWQPMGNDKQIQLNSNSAQGVTTLWNSTTPTSSVFSVVNHSAVNGSGDYIAYCFAEVKGFSKFGSYIGNGSSDGTFVYTGFKPAMVIAKRTDSTGNWRIRDNKRSPNNVITDVLYPNSSSATITEDDHDFLSNGFKVRTTGPENNASGGTYIYAAFAEQPLVGTNNVPTTAR